MSAEPLPQMPEELRGLFDANAGGAASGSAAAQSAAADGAGPGGAAAEADAKASETTKADS